MLTLFTRPSIAFQKAAAAALVLAVALATTSHSPVAAQQEPTAKVLRPIDVMRLQSVSAVRLSPDGKTVAFTRRVPRGPKDGVGGTLTHLFVMPTDGSTPPRGLIVGKASARGFAFSPDGAMVSVVHRGKDEKHAEVWGIPLQGKGDAAAWRKLTTTPRGVSSYRWRPDGKAIAFSITDASPKARTAARKKGFAPKVFDEDFDHISLWLFDFEQKKTRRLTQGLSVFGFEWAPAGDKLAVALAPRNLTDDSYMFKRLYVVDAASGKSRLLINNPGKLGGFAWSPSGSKLAYVSAADARDPHAGMLYVIDDSEDAKPQPYTDGLRGMVHDIAWRGDDEVLATLSLGVYTELTAIRADGRSTIVRGDDVETRHFVHHNDSFVFVGSTASHPSEVFRYADGRLKRCTNSNPWLGEVSLGRQEVVRFGARDGLEIEGLLIYPAGYDRAKRYPFVIVAHGGPESHFSHGWLTGYSRPGQVLAGRGYVAWYPNYRASTGYGVEFAKADHGDPMGREFDDHLDAIAMFDRRGLIDTSRVGVIGGSYGGYTAAWAATKHSEHFAAAVSFVPFVDIQTKWLTSDIPQEFYFVHYQEAWPHEQRAFLAERSPLTFAANCRTPLLLLGGTADPRVHPSQPHMLYRAVKMATQTPTRYIQYPGEGHGNRKNTNQFDYLVRSLRWLEHYLRAGDHRGDALPPPDVDYSSWK